MFTQREIRASIGSIKRERKRKKIIYSDIFMEGEKKSVTFFEIKSPDSYL